jgi:hypothetical protein
MEGWRKLHNKELHEVGGACGRNGGEKECVQVIGSKVKGEETTRKTKT